MTKHRPATFAASKLLLMLFLGITPLMLFSTKASAMQDVTCWNGDCLKNGWTRTNPLDQTFTDYQCYRDGCNQSGWIAGGTQNVEHYTQCKSGGCFTQGWFTMDRQDQTLISQTQCNGDCLTDGWTTDSPAGAVRITCIQHDCAHHGWTSFDPSGNNSAAYCKSSGCFIAGWIESN